MAYERINWQNEPSEATALNDVNLNKMDSAIYDHDQRLDTDESNITDLQSDVGDVQGDITALQNGKVDKVENYGLSLYKSFGYYQLPEGQRGTWIGYVGGVKQNGQLERVGDVYNGVVVDTAMSSSSENPVQNKVVKSALDGKVDKEEGKGLSTLSALGVTASATDGDTIADIVAIDQNGTEYHNPIKNGVVVDSAISSSSENPVQNKVISEAFRDILPEETATGNPITITDGSDLVPASSCKVTMNPIQDLHGYEYPWVGGAGKNKLNMVDVLPSGSYTGNTFNCSSFSNRPTVTLFSEPTSIIFSFKNATFGGSNGRIEFYNGSTLLSSKTLSGENQSDTIQNVTAIKFNYSSGGALSVEEPMLRLATVTDATFAPYENICPISGRNSSTVDRTGKNRINESAITKLIRQGSESTTGITNENGIITVSRQYGSAGQYALSQIIPIKSGSITISADLLLVGTDATDKRARTFVVNPSASSSATSGSAQNLTFTQLNVWEHHSVTYELNENAEDGFCVVLQPIYSGTTLQIKNLQVEAGTSESSYEPYQIETHTHQYAETIWWATDDFASGEMDACGAEIASYNGETLPGEWMSDRDEYAPGTTPTTGAQVVYKNTPTTISTTPEDISLLKGVNVLSTDGDSLEVKYSADIKAYIDSKLEQMLQTLMS